MQGDEASPCSPAGRRGGALSPRGKMRRRLVLRLEDEAAPRSPVGRRGSASSLCGKTRHRLVLPLEDEATPCPRAGRRGVALLPRSYVGRRTVPLGSGQSVYRYPVKALGWIGADMRLGGTRSLVPVSSVHTAST
ncbi:hypothetical protein BHE74_00043407 [Ensete ventricosum]|nr:hypothetical protein GW17_00024076 [Ensete ventricosum]RWW50354.1 hypothetical protein BHE74_00043407 [Ensete ventricosum]